MIYNNIRKGIFLERPNRFIASVDVGGIVEKCHVKNTGRCKELLVKGVDVILQEFSSPDRKTKYDLVAVYKGNRLINIDSQAPNTLVEEALPALGVFKEISVIKREQTFGSSRFDLYVEYGERKAYIEVKGVTLELNNIVMFPDAPTERGLKHIHELIKCVDCGYDAYIIFVIQMSNVNYFISNYETHAEFGDALRNAAAHGVHVLAYDCCVSEDSIHLNNEVPVRYQ